MLDRANLLWLIPALFTIHNSEEALTMKRYLPAAREMMPELRRRVPARLKWLVREYTFRQLMILVVILTAVAWAIAIFGKLDEPGCGAGHALLALQAVLFLNVFAHLGGTVLFRGYAPGLVTAVLFNLPFSWVVFTTAWNEHWYSTTTLLLLGPLALLLHGPVFIGLLRLASRIPAG
jgi:Protein of unknown function with HXXEE motif